MDFEQKIAELKKGIAFKETTEVGDVVLVMMEEAPGGIYGVVTGITADDSRRDEWWHVAICLLGLPPHPTVWTLRTPQFTGQELFTMGGKRRFFKAVVLPGSAPPAPVRPKSGEKKKGVLRVLK